LDLSAPAKQEGLEKLRKSVNIRYMRQEDEKNKGLRERWRSFCDKSLKVGTFLAVRQLKRTSFWTTGLIMIIMLFTFLSLIVVNGIFIGIVEGSSRDYREYYSGDIFISAPEDKAFIKDSLRIVNSLENMEEVEYFSPRYLSAGSVLADYTDRVRPPDLPDRVGVQITGIDPALEDRVTGLSGLVAEGEYLDEKDRNQILIGSSLLRQYSQGVPGVETLEDIEVGSKVQLFVNGAVEEFEIKGVIKSKVGELSRRVYGVDDYLRKLMGRKKDELDEVAVKLAPGYDPESVKGKILPRSFNNENVLVQTSEEAQGEFIKDISQTMNLLSTIVGLISLVVSSITIFIIVFINAISRERYIGILKGIGICGSAVEVSYMMQSFFYVLIGTALGLFFLFGFIKPYIDANPIDFPFSDGIIVVEPFMLFMRIALLFVITIVAGFIPARMVIEKNTLDSILGRKNENS